MATWPPNDIRDQAGKLAIITGGTGGLGLETALRLSEAGAEVVLAGRNSTKGHAAEAAIRQRFKDAKVRFEAVDLARLDSVADFASRLLAEARPIDILVNNAGIMAPRERKQTADGFELQLGTNYLAHFALTGRLLPLLTSGKARVVQLSSIGHRSAKIHLDDLNYERGYKPFPVYGQSKLAMLIFAIELDRQSKANGWGLTSVAAHPGFARTDLVDNGPAVGANAVTTAVFRLLGNLIGHSAAAGVLPTLMAATLPNAKGGQFFGPQGLMELKGPPGPAKIAPRALDVAVASKLWAESERLTGVTFG